MIEAFFFIPVAPNDVERTIYTVKSIQKFCKNFHIFILLDNVKKSSFPELISDEHITLLENNPPTKGHWAKVILYLFGAMFQALDFPNVSKDVIFVKIDADAVVVREKLIERAQKIFRTRPNVGQLGQCYSNVLGGRLGNQGWANFFTKMNGWRGFSRLVSATGQQWTVAQKLQAFHDFRELMRKAHEHGYVDGDFVLGGAYILRKEFIETLRDYKALANTPFLLIPKMNDDVYTTAYVYAMGFSAMDDTADDGLFGIEGKEFRIDPLVLKQRGHYVIHPLKYGYKCESGFRTELQLFEALTETHQAAGSHKSFQHLPQ